MATCTQCGAANKEGAKFCGQCGGATLAPLMQAPAQPVAEPAAQVGRAATMLAYAPPMGAPAPPPPAPPEQAPAPRMPAGGRTMLGVASPMFTPPVAPAPAAPPPHEAQPTTQASPQGPGGGRTMLGMMVPAIAAPPAAAPAPDVNVNARARTMLGVATPGIAPTQSAAREQPAPPVQRVNPLGGTMLGVAIPGIAPTNPGGAPPQAPQRNVAMAATMAAAPPAPVQQPPTQAQPSAGQRLKVANTMLGGQPVMPMPPPFVDDEPAPEGPRERAKPRGVPIGVVVGIVGGIVLLGGAAIAILHRGAPPITAQPRLDVQGNEELHLTCENCADGTLAELDGAKATFKSHEADLALSKPLAVGDNALTLHVDRPGVGRDETVNLVVPVAFRIRADLAGITAKPPVVTVRVAAAPGTDVKVDGKPLALDAKGEGAYAVDVSGDTEGPSDEQRVLDRKIAYEVALKGGPSESGTVTARVAVVPLRVDAPSAQAVVQSASVVVSGQTQAGAQVTIGDKPAATQPDGSFSQTIDAPMGETTLEIRSTAASRAPRTVHATVKRVASLDAEAKAIDAAGKLLDYDAFAPTAAAGGSPARVVVQGEVLEARVVGSQTLALVDDHTGCKAGPCLVRVVASEDAKLTRGAVVRAYGHVTRAVAASGGKNVPEVVADLVVRGHR